MTKLCLDDIRSETPGISERIHLDNAGAGLMPRNVISVIEEHLHLESTLGGYQAAESQQPLIQSAYSDVAQLVGTLPDNIAFTENATTAFASALSCFDFNHQSVILTTQDDYVSNQLMFLSLQQRFGVQIVRAPNALGGGVDVHSMIDLMEQYKPAIVTVTHIPTNSGLIQPVADIGQACREREIWYLVDGCQSIGQVPVDVGSIGCDFFTASFRKFLRGPRGIGFLYASDRVLASDLQPLFPDMRAADWISADRYTLSPTAKRFENWEFAYALLIGAGEASRYARQLGVDSCSRRALQLAAKLRDCLARIREVRVLDQGPELGAIVTITVAGLDGHQLKQELESLRINTSLSLRAYAVIDFTQKAVDWALRLSPHYYILESEIETAVGAIDQLIHRQR